MFKSCRPDFFGGAEKIEQESSGTGEQVKDKSRFNPPFNLLACGHLFT